jgi:hypothetical protein
MYELAKLPLEKIVVSRDARLPFNEKLTCHALAGHQHDLPNGAHQAGGRQA